jgi:SAM-dependent methyltransferase
VRNAYSARWFELFLATADDEQTAREVDFLCRQLPRDRVSSVLDLCCGFGRHAARLADRGYTVAGVDRDPEVVRTARETHLVPNLRFAELDMTRLEALPDRFDAIICMWQSFGYHDAGTNRRIVEQIAGTLRPGGRFVLDVYNRAFFEPRQGTRTTTQQGVEITTTQALAGDRLTVELVYGNEDGGDVFDWQVFTPETLRSVVEPLGFRTVACCTGFDERHEPSADVPRMQLIFETTATG